MIARELQGRFSHRRERPGGQVPPTLLGPDSKVRALRDLRNKYTTTAFYDPLEEVEEGEDSSPPREPAWVVQMRELTPGKARLYTKRMKKELAYKCKCVNESRLMLRVLFRWRAYVDQFVYVRDMLCRVNRLQYLHRVYRAWWLTIQREIRLRIVIRSIAVRLMYRRFRFWKIISRSSMTTRKIARLCLSSWRFYTLEKREIYAHWARLLLLLKRGPAATVIQAAWRGRLARVRWRATRVICRNLFWKTKMWRRVYRARLAAEQRRLVKEEGILALVASRTTMAIKEYMLTLEGSEEFTKYRERLEKHYREYDLDFTYDEKRDVWLDVKKSFETKFDQSHTFLPSILKSAAKGVVKNATTLANAIRTPLVDKVKAFRVVEHRCLRDVKQKAREYYRKKHPPPYHCPSCFRVFMLQIQMDSHLKRAVDCGQQGPKSKGYAYYMAGDFVKMVMDEVMKTFYADIYPTETTIK